MTECCPVCESGESSFFRCIDGYNYFQCVDCGSLHIDASTLREIDAGKSTRVYDESYWRDELIAARERSRGESLVRAGEAILYARRPVQNFLDIGAGPGYLLDELAAQFPRHHHMFHGVELFPPDQHSAHPNYHIGDIGELDGHFDAGVCIEVVEHLTPKMLSTLARGVARVSERGSLWLFNTGMPEMVLEQDPEYLDPVHRGHIVSYSLAGLRRIFEPEAFQVLAMPGKSYAFLVEYKPPLDTPDIEYRVHHPQAENLTLLGESGLLQQASLEAARGSFYYQQFLDRTRWALSLKDELDACRERGIPSLAADEDDDSH